MCDIVRLLPCAVTTFKLYSATQCDSDACLIIHLLCEMESPSNQKLVADSYIAVGAVGYRLSTGRGGVKCLYPRVVKYHWT